MPAQPRLVTANQAVEYAREQLERHSTESLSVELLWTNGRDFIVGVRGEERRDVYIVGPRGRLDLWISGGGLTGLRLATFFTR